MGIKVVFVAIFVALLVGDPLPVDYWVSAGMQRRRHCAAAFGRERGQRG